MRAGDADRRRVVEELQRHYVEGRLSSDELGNRVDQALAARTFGELDAITRDLPRQAQQAEEPERKEPERKEPEWWRPLTRMPGVLLVAMVALLVLTWIAWLPQGGFVAAPVLLLGGVFVFVKR